LYGNNVRIEKRELERLYATYESNTLVSEKDKQTPYRSTGYQEPVIPRNAKETLSAYNRDRPMYV